jgi:hypothetical protein
MDVLFAVVATKGSITPANNHIIVDVDRGNFLTELYVPLIHDKGVSGKEEIENLRQELHGRIDSILDLAVVELLDKKKKLCKKKKGKTTYKVFDCFGKEPRLIDVELDDK